MFQLDFAETFSGLSEREIRELEKDGIVCPQKLHGMKYYTYTDIYVLRIIKILKRIGIKFKKIKLAYQFLQEIKPDQPLSSFFLLHDGKEIYELSDDVTIIATKYGQLAISGVLKLIALGSELEATRQRMTKYTQETKRRAENKRKTGPVYSVEDLDRFLA